MPTTLQGQENKLYTTVVRIIKKKKNIETFIPISSLHTTEEIIIPFPHHYSLIKYNLMLLTHFPHPPKKCRCTLLRKFFEFFLGWWKWITLNRKLQKNSNRASCSSCSPVLDLLFFAFFCFIHTCMWSHTSNFVFNTQFKHMTSMYQHHTDRSLPIIYRYRL